MDKEIKGDGLQESNSYIHEYLQLTPPSMVKLESLEEQIDLKLPDLSLVKEEPSDPSECSFLFPCKASEPPSLHLVKEETQEEVSAPAEEKPIDESNYPCSVCNVTFLNKSICSVHFKLSHQVAPFGTPPAPQSSTKSTKRKRQNRSTKRKRQNSIPAVRKLIDCVRNNPCLYDISNENHTNDDFKQLIWATIAEECRFSDGATAESEWKTLFACLIGSLKNTSNRSPQTWPYRREMEFMLPFVTDDDVYSDQASCDMRQRVEAPSVKRIRTSRTETSASTSSDQPLDLFFRSMCATTKNLPSHIQLQVKKRIFNTVIEAEELVAAVHEYEDMQEDRYPNTQEEHLTPSSSQSNKDNGCASDSFL